MNWKRCMVVLVMAMLLSPSFAFAATVNDPLFPNQWYLDRIDVREAWDVTVGSNDVVVAVIDTGIDVDHEDLRANIYVNEGEIPNNGIDDDGNGFVDDVSGWDTINEDGDVRLSSNPNDSFGVHHGTVVAGVIGAVGNNGIGISGVNQRVKILPIRAIEAGGSGSVADVIEAIEYATLMQVDVINLSFIGPNQALQLRSAMQRAHDQGIVIMAALGNLNGGGQDLDVTPLYPACLTSLTGEDIVFGIAATDQSDSPADFSNYGQNCADVAAPGEQMFSTQYSQFADAYAGGWEGTSLATPVASGIAGLMRARYPHAKPQEVYLALRQGIDPIANEASRGGAGALGSGRVNAYKALVALATIAEDPRSPEQILADERAAEEAAARAEAQLEVNRPLVISAGVGNAPYVSVIQPNGRTTTWLAYDEGFRGGVYVAVGQLDDDADYEVVTVPAAGGGSHVRVFNMRGQLEEEFFASEEGFRGGHSVAIGNIDSIGAEEILLASGPGRRREVQVFNKNGALQTRVALDVEEDDVVWLSSGDVDLDGADDIIVSRNDGEPLVDVYRIYGSQHYSFFGDGAWLHGATRTLTQNRAGAKAIIIVRRPHEINPLIRRFTDIGALVNQFDPGLKLGDNSDIAFIGSGSEELIALSSFDTQPHVHLFDLTGAPLGELTLSPFFQTSVNLSK